MFDCTFIHFQAHACSCIMPQENSVTEAVSNEDNIKIKLDQSCGDTEPSDDFFGDGETRASLQSVAKSSSLGSSTDISETTT